VDLEALVPDRGLGEGRDPFHGIRVLAAHTASLEDVHAVVREDLLLRGVRSSVHADDHLRLQW
jgi:hypothetical protein